MVDDSLDQLYFTTHTEYDSNGIEPNKKKNTCTVNILFYRWSRLLTEFCDICLFFGRHKHLTQLLIEEPLKATFKSFICKRAIVVQLWITFVVFWWMFYISFAVEEKFWARFRFGDILWNSSNGICIFLMNVFVYFF